MLRARVSSVAACAACAVAVAACGTTSKPLAGTPGILSKPGIRAKIDDPRTSVNNHLACIKQAGLPVTEATIGGVPGLQIGAAPAGPTVRFLASPGAAQFAQISGTNQGAEVIGSALVYPNGGSDGELTAIEDCLSQGVTG
jgi:hypothetical protein